MSKKAIIIGAGPAGLTAAYELLQRTDITPIILEKSDYIGGISRTINYKGNRMDMGPHRFFSKSDRVMNWWMKIMPLEKGTGEATTISYQNKSRVIEDPCQYERSDTSGQTDKVMLVIQRLTRIYFLRKFFAYPIQLSIDTLRTLGFIRTIKIMFSFLYVRLFPKKPEKSLEDFIINKFGKQLYLLFFKDYTEKVWGVPCGEISAEWGAQRIKGVSLSKAVLEALKTMRKKKGTVDLGQKGTETSLIEQFLYPKYGPGSLWEEVARQVEEMGGIIRMNQDVQSIYRVKDEICSVHTIDSQTGELTLTEGDYFFSTMPVKELIAGMGETIPPEVQEVAAGLQYRDFINVGILLKHLSAPVPGTDLYEKLELKDNWIYIQERDVKVGRLMIYNNWGTGMIKDPNTTWIGMEYFCNETDDFWALDDETIQGSAIMELERMGLARVEDVLDITVRRMKKTYPAYFGTYDRFEVIKNYTDTYTNLFLVGRNGMHKYNNADHSMLTAMVAVDNIVAGVMTKENIWSINTEQEYHEEKTHAEVQPSTLPPVHNKRAPLGEPSFPDFLWKKQWNRGFLIGAGIVWLMQFLLFKSSYPYANYMPDSYSYLEAAARNLDVNMWPVAYSKFLRLVSVFTHSDKVVVGLQYFFLQGSALLFLYTILYWLKPGRIVQGVLLVFFIVDPITLYVANYISADALFIGFSLLWLTTLFWILYRPKPYQLGLQAILLLACFTLRYNAIYYPVIAALVFILSRQNWRLKLGGIAAGSLLVVASILYTSEKMKEVTDHRQFSAFGGWQLANNALYMYEHIPAQDRGPVPVRFAKLETMVRQHMDTLKRVKFTHDDSVNSYFYLWSGKGPLIQYLVQDWKKDSTTDYFKRWASEAPLYANYARYLIQKYPVQFAETWLLSNSLKLVVPPVEFLGVYNMGADSVGKIAKDWFNYKSLKVQNHTTKNSYSAISDWYPIFIALINCLSVLSILMIFPAGWFKRKRGRMMQASFMLLVIWSLNSCFSIVASPIVLRYQLFTSLVCLSLSLVLLESFYQQLIAEETTIKLAKQ